VYIIFTGKQCFSENLTCWLVIVELRAATSKVNLMFYSHITSQEGLTEEARIETAACFISIST
jgi:hypothetical protein